MPKVSVVMSVYNSEIYISQAIESILNQTFTDFEFIIINDGSTDDTSKIISSYIDPRIIYITNKKNIGLTKSLNKGLALAKGTYIARMDADDYSLPNRFAVQVAYLDKHPAVGLLAGNIEIIDEKGIIIDIINETDHPDLIKWSSLFYNNIPAHSETMFRAKLIQQCGEYSETLETTQDYDLWSRMAKKTHIVILPEVLLKWRIHKKSISSTRLRQQQQTAYSIACQNIDNLMKHKKISRETCLEMIGFWMGRFSMCQNPFRIWYYLAQLKGYFIRQRTLMSSVSDFSAMLKKCKSQKFFQLTHFWLANRRYLLSFLSGLAGVISSPSELYYKLKRRLTRRLNEAA